MHPESDWFAEYAEVVSKALADRVQCWLTFNEPQMFCGLGLVAGVHAPFEHNDDQTMMGVTRNILLAHGRAVQVMRKNCPGAKVGMAPTGDCCLPKDDSPEEVEKARQKSLSDYPGYIMSNTWWADPVFLGQYPAWAKEKFGDQLYTMTPEEWALVSQPLDFYAYNCYQGTVDIVPDPSKYDAYAYQGSPQTAAAWNITPKVLYHASKFWFERYHLPILITENGYSGLDCVMLDGEVHDPQRIDFLHRYLLEVAHAMADGIPVIGNAAGLTEIEFYLLLCRQRMYHICYTADKVDGIEHVYCLRTVRHGDGDSVALAHTYSTQRARAGMHHLDKVRIGLTSAHEVKGNGARIFACDSLDSLKHCTGKIVKMHRNSAEMSLPRSLDPNRCCGYFKLHQ